MQIPDRPIDEEFRTMALDGLSILDTGPDPEFDRIVALGKQLFQVPMCLVSLIDRDRQWFKAKIGLEANETPRDLSFCGHAILTSDVLVVLDATRDVRFHDNPVVTGPPHVRFYAGAPITLPNGYAIGTVCIIAPEARLEFSEAESQQLVHLADLVVNILSVRALRQELDLERTRRLQLIQAIGVADQPIALLDPDGRILEMNEAFIAMGEDYVSPGSNIWDATTLTPDDLETARVSLDGTSTVRLESKGLEKVLTVHCHGDSFVVCG